MLLLIISKPGALMWNVSKRGLPGGEPSMSGRMPVANPYAVVPGPGSRVDRGVAAAQFTETQRRDVMSATAASGD